MIMVKSNELKQGFNQFEKIDIFFHLKSILFDSEENRLFNPFSIENIYDITLKRVDNVFMQISMLNAVSTSDIAFEFSIYIK